uniref:G protein-coupled receptor 135 n=1 Tax=Sinocyclocheilus anshuiensis TaxID=1608454 RepID=A0A671M3Z2_9TELE
MAKIAPKKTQNILKSKCVSMRNWLSGPPSSSVTAEGTGNILYSKHSIVTIKPVVNSLSTQASNYTAAGEMPSNTPVKSSEGNSVLQGIAVAAQALLLLAIFLLSSLGNSAVVVVIVKHRQLRTVTNAFVMSLSLSDFLTAVLCLPFSFTMLFSKDGKWMFGEPFCVANGFFSTCFGIISTLTMTLISFDRYYAIVRQPQAKIGRRRAIQLLAAVWFSAVVFSFPWYLLVETSRRLVVHKQGFYHCMYVFHSGTSRMGTAYSVALIVACYLLPFALMCFCHYNICKTVRLSEIRVRPVTTYAHLLRFYSEMPPPSKL